MDIRNKVIERFIKTMGITYNVEFLNFTRGSRILKPAACFEVKAYHEKEVIFHNINCYSLRSDGNIQFEDGNYIVDVNAGMFSSLGLAEDVYQFFREKLVKAAKEFFQENNISTMSESRQNNNPKKIGNFISKGHEHYGLGKEIFLWFMRRFGVFSIYLEDVIKAVVEDEYDWLKDESRNRFIDLVLIYALLDFFYNELEKEYDVEDFQRNGEQENWLYLVRDVYEDELGDLHDEIAKKS